jgi:hypothetical protein
MPLTPELLAALKESLANGDISTQEISNLTPMGRSPIRPRQLHDLTLTPTKDDPRPTFFWSAEKPRDGSGFKTSEFPKLMWSPKGQEITVISRTMQAERERQGYLLTCPADVVIEPLDLVRAQWEALSAEDREVLTESYRQDRRNALLAKMGSLDPSQIETLLASQDKQARRKSA